MYQFVIKIELISHVAETKNNLDLFKFKPTKYVPIMEIKKRSNNIKL
jgi:hypothetical protein